MVQGCPGQFSQLVRQRCIEPWRSLFLRRSLLCCTYVTTFAPILQSPGQIALWQVHLPEPEQIMDIVRDNKQPWLCPVNSLYRLWLLTSVFPLSTHFLFSLYTLTSELYLVPSIIYPPESILSNKALLHNSKLRQGFNVIYYVDIKLWINYTPNVCVSKSAPWVTHGTIDVNLSHELTHRIFLMMSWLVIFVILWQKWWADSSFLSFSDDRVVKSAFCTFTLFHVSLTRTSKLKLNKVD